MADVASAVVRRACVMFGVDSGSVVIDTTRNFFSLDGFELGDHAFDSMDLVELLITLGDELDIPLIELTEDGDAHTLADVAAIIAASASTEVVAAFCARWSASSTEP
jgi:hypothetical protein